MHTLHIHCNRSLAGGGASDGGGGVGGYCAQCPNPRGLSTAMGCSPTEVGAAITFTGTRGAWLLEKLNSDFTVTINHLINGDREMGREGGERVKGREGRERGREADRGLLESLLKKPMSLFFFFFFFCYYLSPAEHFN